MNLQGFFSTFFFLLFYIPFNVIIMLAAAFVLGLVNRLFHLNFPTWLIGLAAGLLAGIIVYAVIEGSTNKLGASPELLYTTTFIIHVLLFLLLLTFSGIGKLIFRNAPAVPFHFEKPQAIAATIYTASILAFALLPLLAKGKAYLQDVADKKYTENLQMIINTNDTTAFKKALDNNYQLADVKLNDYSTQSLFDYLLEHNKTALVKLLVAKNTNLVTYHSELNINSEAMLQVLLEAGLPTVDAIQQLTLKNDTALVKLTVEKFHPQFDTCKDYMVALITRDVLGHGNIDLLDYLIEHGLAKNISYSSNALYQYVEKNDLQTVQLLINKGFSLDTANSQIVEKAISNRNLPMLAYLFQYPFDKNKKVDGYSYLEKAILSNGDQLINFLLMQQPDVTTIHVTDGDGVTNALLLAEKYERTEMLAKLKRYVSQNKTNQHA